MSGWRVLRIALLLLLLLIALLPLGAWRLLGSEAGSDWLLRQLAERGGAVGVEFRYAHRSGDLLGRLELHDVRVAVAETQIAVRQLVLDWRPQALFARRVHVNAIEVTGLQLTLPPSAPADEAPPQLPDLTLPLALQIERLQIDDAVIATAGDAPLSIEHVALGAAIDRAAMTLRDLQWIGAGARLAGWLDVQTVAPHALRGRLDMNLEPALTGETLGAVEADATLRGGLLRPGFDLRIRAPAAVHLQGTLALDRLQPAFELAAEWPALDWPLRGDPQLVTRDGRLTVSGTIDDYRAALRAHLQAPDLPPAEVEIDAQGGLDHLRLQPLTLRLADGQMQADGDLSWRDRVSWRFDLRAERLNPAVLAADWPGRIDGRLQVEGQVAPAGGVAIRAQIAQLDGQLRGYPVSASGSIDWDAGRLHAQSVEVASGPNRIAVDGQVDQAIDLRYRIQAPYLAALYPGLQGRLDGGGRLGGTTQHPALAGQIAGSDLVYGELGARRVELDLDWQNDAGSGRARVSGLKAGEQAFDQVAVDLSGSLAEHRVALRAYGDAGRAALTMQGGIVDSAWQGQLRALEIDEPRLGEWRLRRPAALQLAAERVHAERLCLGRDAAELCMAGGWSQTSGLDLVGGLRGLDLALLNPQFDGQAEIAGRLAADFKVLGPPASPQVDFDLRPGSGRVRLPNSEPPLDLAFRDAHVSGRFAEDRGRAELGFALGDNGQARGTLTLGTAAAGRTLGGELHADFPDLALVAGFVPALDEVRGRLRVAARLGGTLEQPAVTGTLEVQDASARILAAGILVEDIALTVRGDGLAPLQVHGSAHSGGGELTVAGNVDLAADGGPRVDLEIDGTDFEAAKLTEAVVLVSPALRFQGQGPYHLSGTLRVPRAAITLQELPKGTVEVSGDEIIVGRPADGPDGSVPGSGSRNLTAKVRLELGKQVTFSGFGLDTRLVGALDAAVNAKGTTLDGKIELRDGRYEAYGQDLQVELGRLLFAGPPGDPDVDLRALRVSRDGEYKAYLALSGPLSKPRARVYTEPALPESQAVSYLLTGRSLDQAGQGDGSAIAAAALSLGISRGEPLLQDLSERLGLDDLRVEGGENALEDSSLVLGKYLNPDLYLGYSQGLFNPEGAVLLRLRLSKRFELESRSGNEQSVDLLYRLEHN